MKCSSQSNMDCLGSFLNVFYSPLNTLFQCGKWPIWKRKYISRIYEQRLHKILMLQKQWRSHSVEGLYQRGSEEEQIVYLSNNQMYTSSISHALSILIFVSIYSQFRYFIDDVDARHIYASSTFQIANTVIYFILNQLRLRFSCSGMVRLEVTPK